MKSIERRSDEFVSECRETGLKATHQRIEIFRELACMDSHPDAESLYRAVRKRLPTISFDTVYRTLRILEEKGLIKRIGPPLDRGKFDGNLTPHHHFVCTKCGMVGDFYDEKFDHLNAPREALQYGTPETVRVEVYGICKACRETE